jgi:transcriptional regulator with XRE-family HTH domain
MLSRTELLSQGGLGDTAAPLSNNASMASELWQRLRALRSRTGLSGEAFGAKLDASKAAVSQWEASEPERRTTPDLAKVVRMKQCFGVPLDWLLDDASDPDFAWWELPIPTRAAGTPGLVDTLEALGEHLSRTPPDVREAVATNLAGWARDGGKDHWRQGLQALMQAAPRKHKDAA